MKLKSILFLLLAVLCLGVTALRGGAAPPEPAPPSPFVLSVVPSKSHPSPAGPSIAMAEEKADVFHVVLTNVSGEAQPVFESWNSWGYQAVSFEITLPDGRRTILSVADRDFTRNFASIYTIPPGEHQVFPIRLDRAWGMKPEVSFGPETKITLKAVYEVAESREAKDIQVWTGRVESKPQQMTLRHWEQAK